MPPAIRRFPDSQPRLRLRRRQRDHRGGIAGAVPFARLFIAHPHLLSRFALGSAGSRWVTGWLPAVPRTHSRGGAPAIPITRSGPAPRLNSRGRLGQPCREQFRGSAQPGNRKTGGCGAPPQMTSDSDLDHYHDRTKRPQKRIPQEARLCPSGRPGSGRFRPADNGPVTGRRAGQRRVPGQTHGRRPTGQHPRISPLSAAVCIRPPPAGRRAGRDRCIYPPLTDLNPYVYAHGLSGAAKAVRTQVTSKAPRPALPVSAPNPGRSLFGPPRKTRTHPTPASTGNRRRAHAGRLGRGA